MKLYFKDIYGSTASIHKWGEKWILTVRNCYGDIFHKKNYTTYKGARIALGRMGDEWTKK